MIPQIPQPKYKFHHQKHSSKKLHKHCDRVQFKEKADIDVCMWLPVKSVSMTRVIQWTLFSAGFVTMWRVTVTILARWMIVYPVTAGHVTAPESGPEIREWEMVGVTRRRITRSTSPTPSSDQSDQRRARDTNTDWLDTPWTKEHQLASNKLIY